MIITQAQFIIIILYSFSQAAKISDFLCALNLFADDAVFLPHKTSRVILY